MRIIIGYVLIVLGLTMIIWPLWQSYNIFMGKAPAPLVFQTAENIGSSAAGSDLQSQITKAVQDQLKQFVSPATATKVLNLIAWTLMAFILITAGGAVSSIGTKMIRS